MTGIGGIGGVSGGGNPEPGKKPIASGKAIRVAARVLLDTTNPSSASIPLQATPLPSGETDSPDAGSVRVEEMKKSLAVAGLTTDAASMTALGEDAMQTFNVLKENASSPQVKDLLTNVKDVFNVLWQNYVAPVIAGLGTAIVSTVHLSLTPIGAGLAIAVIFLCKLFTYIAHKITEKSESLNSFDGMLTNKLEKLNNFLRFATNPATIKKRFDSYNNLLREGTPVSSEIKADFLCAVAELVIALSITTPAAVGAPAMVLAIAAVEVGVLSPAVSVWFTTWGDIFTSDAIQARMAATINVMEEATAPSLAASGTPGTAGAS